MQTERKILLDPKQVQQFRRGESVSRGIETCLSINPIGSLLQHRNHSLFVGGEPGFGKIANGRQPRPVAGAACGSASVNTATRSHPTPTVIARMVREFVHRSKKHK
jgi:hypothetical protein